MPTGHRGNDIGEITQEQHKTRRWRQRYTEPVGPMSRQQLLLTLAKDGHTAVRTLCGLEHTVFQKEARNP